jgi:hypothetical protein
MRLITPEEMLAIAGGEGESTANAGGGTTTTTSTNGTTTTTTSYANGTTMTVVTRPDGHGSVITTTTTTNPSGEVSAGIETKMGGGRGKAGASGGTSNKSIIVNFSAFEFADL